MNTSSVSNNIYNCTPHSNSRSYCPPPLQPLPSSLRFKSFAAATKARALTFTLTRHSTHSLKMAESSIFDSHSRFLPFLSSQLLCIWKCNMGNEIIHLYQHFSQLNEILVTMIASFLLLFLFFIRFSRWDFFFFILELLFCLCSYFFLLIVKLIGEIMLVIAIPIKSMRRLLWCVMVKQHGMLMEEFRFFFFFPLSF